MTEWKRESCGSEKPAELQLVSHEKYIQRRNIVLIDSEEDDFTQKESHYECESRFLSVSEYCMLESIKEIENNKAIDAYTLQLIEDGLI